MTYLKVGTRYAILAVLGMVLMIVAKPTKASAIDSACLRSCAQQARLCMQECLQSGSEDCFGCSDQEMICTDACNGD
jgi:hypothetical protein